MDTRRSPKGLYQVIIAQSSHREHGPYMEGFPTITAEAFLVKDGKLEKPLWKLSERAHKGEVKYVQGPDYYQTVISREPEAETLFGLYNAYSGKELFHYTRKLLSVSIPNTPQANVRLIAYRQLDPKQNQQIGSLYYSSSDSTLHELSIYMSKPELNYDGGDFSFSNLLNLKDKLRSDNITLWSKDFSINPKSFTGFSVKLEYEEMEVIIPITNDDFDLTSFASNVIRIERIK